MKVFICYSRLDASEIAKAIHNHLTDIGYPEVFIDASNFYAGDEWGNTLSNPIIQCDIFVIIVTPSALRHQAIEKEFELAKKLKKKIIPCVAKRDVHYEDLKWDLNKYQGIKFERLDDLIKKFDYMIQLERKTRRREAYSFPILEKQKFDDALGSLEIDSKLESKDPKSWTNKAKLLEQTNNFDDDALQTQIDKNSAPETISKEKSISKQKIFISYSRDDAEDFANHIYKFLKNKGYAVFIDVNNIRVGDPWAGSIEKNISECDIFVVLLTPDSLTSTYVENEVLQAQKQNKIIVPCKYEDVEYSEIRWGLEKVQGIEFPNRSELTRKLYPKIKNYINI